MKETQDIFAFLKETIKYIEFVGKTKDYGNINGCDYRDEMWRGMEIFL